MKAVHGKLSRVKEENTVRSHLRATRFKLSQKEALLLSCSCLGFPVDVGICLQHIPVAAFPDLISHAWGDGVWLHAPLCQHAWREMRLPKPAYSWTSWRSSANTMSHSLPAPGPASFPPSEHRLQLLHTGNSVFSLVEEPRRAPGRRPVEGGEVS